MNEIFIIEQETPGETTFLNVRESGEVITTTEKYIPGVVIQAKPTMILDERLTRALVAAFVDHA
ncbi:MAG TPA: hypothetical protein VF679_01020, partial [Pedobacter sp.]